MRKEYTFLILGIWLVILPYLGFPYSWKNVLTTLSGFGLVYASFVMYKEFKAKETKEIKEEKTFDNFSENHFDSGEKI